VIGVHPARGFAVDAVGPTTEALLRKANFEVIVDRPATALAD
jgi:acetolactate synthase regulatory subunit